MVKNTKKILITGLPGSGKTTLAYELATILNAVHFNADQVRASLNRHLSFSLSDRIEQAKTMKALCDKATRNGLYTIADFVCPTEETRKAFGAEDSFVIWVDRIQKGRFEDTNKLFTSPKKFDVHVTREGSAKEWAVRIAQIITKDQTPLRPGLHPRHVPQKIGAHQPLPEAALL